MLKLPLTCPNGHGTMILTKRTNTIVYKGKLITYTKESYVCSTCELEACTIEQAGNIQEQIREAIDNKTFQ